jgi:DNA-binding NarL/FixJ family response regulator
MSSVDADRVELSRRQHEVLVLLGAGLGARAIAARLGIRETTARNHIHRLLQRLGCHSQLQAVARARERHLL